MNSRSLAWIMLVGCASLLLSACSVEELDAADVEEADAVTSEGAVADVSLGEALNPGEGPSDAVHCGGSGNYCLAKCSKTGSDTLHVVGTLASVGAGHCINAGETYCKSHGLGYRIYACWGYVTNGAMADDGEADSSE